MLSTIFTGIPQGVSVRRLDVSRKAPKQNKPYTFTAWKDGTQRVYGNSIRDVLKKLNQEPTVEMR